MADITVEFHAFPWLVGIPLPPAVYYGGARCFVHDKVLRMLAEALPEGHFEQSDGPLALYMYVRLKEETDVTIAKLLFSGGIE